MMGSTADQYWMQRACALAEKGRLNTSPNPRVGCVVVHRDSAIAEGWHAQVGGAHAESRALGQLAPDDSRLSSSTVYVTLEPCNHHGRTPPCSAMLVERGIQRVVVGMVDPDPRVAGSGIARLRSAGIEVTVMDAQPHGRWLNRRFLSSLERGRPWVVLKCAVSKDGFADPQRTPGQKGSLPITSPVLKTLTHFWRSEEQAILVGAGTVSTDNPRLNVRNADGPDPQPVVLDPNGRTDPNAHVYAHPGAVVLGGPEGLPAHVVRLNVTAKPAIETILEYLQQSGCRSVLVEGGPKTLMGFFESGHWDEARWCWGSNPTGGGVPAPALPIEGIMRGCHPWGQDRVEYYVSPASLKWTGHVMPPTLALPLPT